MRTKLLNADYYQTLSFRERGDIIRDIKLNQSKKLWQILSASDSSGSEPELPPDCHYLTILDDNYPVALKEIYDPPLVLYYKGDINLLEHQRKIAVVGSRTPQNISLRSARNTIRQLNKHNFLAVSGLANGIDRNIHIEALAQHLPTIAVLGAGFDHIYPLTNTTIFKNICQHGLAISEYPPYIKAQKWQFVARNRIIAGLVSGVIVIEAKEKSGTMLTARFALAENRELYVVGGHSLDPSYRGSNKLIQEGAKLFIDIDDILEDF
ncbi:DNA-processing protein DprA [Culicoidibacter larvae]|uniref:DNA-protecting protein DprA n=1 Tax=Culicoidibacter larvae TaxID=2579976 RepID=A0A5R8Q9G8_9FIRM|nr:DNA-processing protein DprA [Culicoidibacter larvae]TLG72563.1 DNA-protecting protein DprA [Culicoidibacter larvae]